MFSNLIILSMLVCDTVINNNYYGHPGAIPPTNGTQTQGAAPAAENPTVKDKKDEEPKLSPKETALCFGVVCVILIIAHACGIIDLPEFLGKVIKYSDHKEGSTHKYYSDKPPVNDGMATITFDAGQSFYAPKYTSIANDSFKNTFDPSLSYSNNDYRYPSNPHHYITNTNSDHLQLKDNSDSIMDRIKQKYYLKGVFDKLTLPTALSNISHRHTDQMLISILYVDEFINDIAQNCVIDTSTIKISYDLSSPFKHEITALIAKLSCDNNYEEFVKHLAFLHELTNEQKIIAKKYLESKEYKNKLGNIVKLNIELTDPKIDDVE